MFVHLEFPIKQNCYMVSILFAPYSILENSRGEKGKFIEILQRLQCLHNLLE